MHRRVVLIVGGGAGIGRSTAEHLAQCHSRVVVADIDRGAAESTAEAVSSAGGEAVAVQADATKVADVRSAVDVAVARFGRLDAAVLSVFRDSPAPITELSEEGWDGTIAVGLRSAYVLAHVALPQLCAAEEASLTFVSSIQASFGYQGMAAYSAAKAGLLGLVRQLAVEYGPLGVRVNAVLPALVLTERNRPAWEARPDLFDRQQKLFPLRRAGRPADVATVIRFLISADAGFITGASIPVDGGMAAQPAAAGNWGAYITVRDEQVAPKPQDAPQASRSVRSTGHVPADEATR